MSIKFAEELRLIRKDPAGGTFPSNRLPKQHGEEASGHFHHAQPSCVYLSFIESLGTRSEYREPRHCPPRAPRLVA